jgi:hypothetical protein
MKACSILCGVGRVKDTTVQWLPFLLDPPAAASGFAFRISSRESVAGLFDATILEQSSISIWQFNFVGFE